MSLAHDVGIPLVSVVMPVYNASRFLRPAIESVLNQTYRNLELIVIDDCSTDDSLQIIREYAAKDTRIYVIECESNGGVAAARNRGIRASRGAYIALLDSDDVWVPNKLERQISLFFEKKADIVYCSLDFIDENGSKFKKPFIVRSETDYHEMMFRCYFSCSSIIVKAELFKEHLFSTEYYHEDLLLWLELLSLPVKAVGDIDVLAYYRQISGSRSNNKIQSAKNRWKIYREALQLSVLKSAFLFVKYAFWGIRKYYY